MDSRPQRVAKNEALFRQVNERIEDVNQDLDSDSPSDFLCECGDDNCTAPVSLTRREYEAVRSDPTHFVIAPGHEVVDVERVVLENQDGVRSAPIKAKVTERIRGDCVYMVHGFGTRARDLTKAYQKGASDTQLITRVAVDPIMGATGMRVNFVRVIPANGKEI